MSTHRRYRRRQPPYSYVRQAYGVDPVIGSRVRHTVTGEYGVIAPERASHQHYVDVRFDGDRCALPCHPTELDYSPTIAGDQQEIAA